MKLLLLEDDLKLASILISSLKEIGFLVEHSTKLEEFRQLVAQVPEPDLLILDRLIGTEDSKDLIADLRKMRPHTPMIILSAINTPNEKSDLLDLGADDYVGKPFVTQELIARIRALLRRSATTTAKSFIVVGNLKIDSNKRIVSVDHKSEMLPTKEYLLLQTLAEQKGRVWNKYDLLQQIWGQQPDIETNVVEATIANIRKKLLELGAQVSIKNARNLGYWIED